MKMFFNKRFAGIAFKRIKKIMCAAVSALVCIMPLTLNAAAEEGGSVRLEASGSEAVLELCFPQAAVEEISSMQMAVGIKVNSNGADLEFIPDSGLSSKIAESRYRADTGVLNIYLAGTKALFSSSGIVKVGKIRISASAGSSASATVTVIKNSIRFVRGDELVPPDSEPVYPAAVSISAQGQSLPGTPAPEYPSYPENTNYPEYTDYPSTNYFPNVSVPTVEINYSDYEYGGDVSNESGDSGDYDAVRDNDPWQDGYSAAVDNPNPPDMAALLEAISRAESYRKSDYTESSYNTLSEAVKKARAIASDPIATQEEIDDALLDIENAIGMLQPRNNLASGEKGYGVDTGGIYGESYVGGEYDENGQPLDGENGDRGNNANDIQAAQNINDSGLPAGKDVFPDGASSKKEDGGVNYALWIIVLSAIVFISSAAVIVIKEVKKKKSTGGEHFKK